MAPVPPSASAPNIRKPPSPIADGFALAAVSCHPDPTVHAYRKDLADVALAGQVIASHYAEPLARRITAPTDLRIEARADSDSLAILAEGEPFRMLDCTRGWAWGYAADGRVGYVSDAAIGA